MVTELTIQQRDRAIMSPTTLKSEVRAAVPRFTWRDTGHLSTQRVNTNNSFHKATHTAQWARPTGTIKNATAQGIPRKVRAEVWCSV